MSTSTRVSDFSTEEIGLPPVSPSEHRWVLVAAALLMLLTTLPYLIGYASQGEHWRFTGFVFGVDDGNSYIAKMRAGAEGNWLFRTPYSTFPQRGLLAFLPYMLLGKLTSPPAQHEQLVALFHLSRFLSGTLMMLATYDFLAFFVRRVSLRRLGMFLACFGGGLGWLLAFLGQGGWLGSLPLDFYSPESFGFLSFFGLPHLAFARALFLWSLLIYIRSIDHYEIVRFRLPAGFLAGCLWLIMGFFQPLTIVVAWAAVGAHLIGFSLALAGNRRRHPQPAFHLWRSYLQRAVVAGVISSPFVLYNVFTLLSDPFFQAWGAQNLIRSPHPLHYLAAYALIIPYAIVGARRLHQKMPITVWLPVIWVVMLPFLAYAPFNLQRRLPEGIWVALCLLAVTAFDGDEKPPRTHLYAQLPLVLTFLTSLFLWTGGLNGARTLSVPIFRPAEEVATFLFLDGQAQPGEVVLSTYETGNALPAWAPLRVVLGHGPETIGGAELRAQIEAFFQAATSDAERLAFLQEQNVHYVFWGPAERALGDWHPVQAGYLQEIYAKDEYSIFAISNP